MSTPTQPLMPKATAVWLVDNTALSFEQIAQFCGMHILEIKGIADGDVAQGVRGKNPITAGELAREEIARAEQNSDYRLKLMSSKVKIPEIKAKKRPRYTPVSRRQDRPNAVLWILRNHGELKDSQIMRLVGTTKPTIGQIRDRSHWNSANLVAQDPVMLGLCSQVDLDMEVEKASKRVAKERKAMGLPPLEAVETLLPTAETTDYEMSVSEPKESARPAPTAENIFGRTAPSEPTTEEVAEADETARVFARLKDMKPTDQVNDAEVDAETPPAVTLSPANQPHLEAVLKYVPDCDQDAVKGIIRHLGIALRSKDASLVACSSKDELDRVRESWCKKKLELSESDEALDAMIQTVCETMQGDRQKNRVAFYYLLAEMNDKIGDLS